VRYDVPIDELGATDLEHVRDQIHDGGRCRGVPSDRIEWHLHECTSECVSECVSEMPDQQRAIQER